MKKNNEYVGRHGYLILPRHAKLLQMDLKYELFGFYMALVMESHWVRDNDTFGYVCSSQVDLAKKINTSQSTVSRLLSKLEKKGYIIRHTPQERIYLKFFPLFDNKIGPKLHSKDYADLNELYADVHKINANLQENYAYMKDTQPQNKDISIISSSYNSNNLIDLVESLDNENKS